MLMVALSGIGGWAQTPQTSQPPSPKAQTPGQAQPQGGQRPDGPSRGSGHFWWKDPAVVKEINLTPRQVRRIDALWNERNPEAMVQWSEFKKQEKELSRLMSERTVGPDVIAVQVDQVEAQRTTLNKTRTMMIYQMYMVLAADQYAKLVAYNERKSRGRGDPRSR